MPTITNATKFQSSPGPGAGCCRPRRRTPPSSTPCFNPHPARGPGAAVVEAAHEQVVMPVSILTRPGGRVLLDDLERLSAARKRVSILTRPGGRVLPLLLALGRPYIIEFQSSPGPGAGCCWPPVADPAQSHLVSILTRPGGRVLRESNSCWVICSSRFQSSPGPGAGCCRREAIDTYNDACRVSILTRPGGRVLPAQCPIAHGPPTSSFNPHPARGPGAAGEGIRDRVVAMEQFQSSPGPGAGCCVTYRRRSGRASARFQSSPGPGAGCCRILSRQ